MRVWVWVAAVPMVRSYIVQGNRVFDLHIYMQFVPFWLRDELESRHTPRRQACAVAAPHRSLQRGGGPQACACMLMILNLTSRLYYHMLYSMHPPESMIMIKVLTRASRLQSVSPEVEHTAQAATYLRRFCRSITSNILIYRVGARIAPAARPSMPWRAQAHAASLHCTRTGAESCTFLRVNLMP